MKILNGIDLVEIERFSQMDEKIMNRFIERVFTHAEIEESNRSFEYLAGRFAAKEAVVKALGTGIGAIHWQDVEILTNQDGAPILNLYNEAAAIADRLHVVSWGISISHTGQLAISQAVALTDAA